MNDTPLRPGLLRRLAAVGYDFLLLLSVWFLASFLILPFTHGEAVDTSNWWFKLYLLVVTFLFYAWFWTHGGQTLGMRAWRMKLLTEDRKTIGWGRAALRFSVAGLSWGAFGLGWLWMLWDRDQNTWHDTLSRSRMFMTPKPDKKKK
ncbi:MAG: RDD family protein [Gammaproteobacteria bacterium]|nr:RDD family protein [Gammaproteobacteria bacterium]MCP5136954.1 RDD family protein [Gammaproteobacteria bacterium]